MVPPEVQDVRRLRLGVLEYDLLPDDCLELDRRGAAVTHPEHERIGQRVRQRHAGVRVRLSDEGLGEPPPSGRRLVQPLGAPERLLSLLAFLTGQGRCDRGLYLPPRLGEPSLDLCHVLRDRAEVRLHLRQQRLARRHEGGVPEQRRDNVLGVPVVTLELLAGDELGDARLGVAENAALAAGADVAPPVRAYDGPPA